MACIWRNVAKTEPLCRGTRQGRPLSTVLFHLIIEPLAQKIRDSEEIQGTSVLGIENKVSLYADDLMLFIQDINKSWPLLQEVIEIFGQELGCKLNYSKSEIICLSFKVYPIHEKCLLKVLNNKIRYLGIHVSAKVGEFFSIQFYYLQRPRKVGVITIDFDR